MKEERRGEGRREERRGEGRRETQPVTDREKEWRGCLWCCVWDCIDQTTDDPRYAMLLNVVI